MLCLQAGISITSRLLSQPKRARLQESSTAATARVAALRCQLIDDLDDHEQDLASPGIIRLILEDGELWTQAFPLAAGSEFFRAMLRHSPLKESYIFDDMSVATARQLRNYLYTGRLKEGSEVRQLLGLADKYLIPLLKEDCIQALVTAGVDEDNWKELMELGECHQVDILHEMGLDYFMQHREQILRRSDWDAALDPRQYRAIVEACSGLYR